MSYKIEPVSVKEFVTDSKMKLPRFQRKATWKPKQNFESAKDMSNISLPELFWEFFEEE